MAGKGKIFQEIPAQKLDAWDGAVFYAVPFGDLTLDPLCAPDVVNPVEFSFQQGQQGEVGHYVARRPAAGQYDGHNN